MSRRFILIESIVIYYRCGGDVEGESLTVYEENACDRDIIREKIRARYQETNNANVEVIPAKPRNDDIFNTDRQQRVAVYARVSTDGLSQVSSYELQKAYYGDMVSQRPNWHLVGIYADEGISGTSLTHRDDFLRMVNDCMKGKVDLVVTKSVSRFARNIVDCIGIVRKLRALNPPVGVYFESENIYTLLPDYEMQLTFTSSMAQEESHIKSKTMNTSYEMRFKRGLYMTPELYGYDRDENGKLIVNEEESRVVTLIFYLFLYGFRQLQIAERLTGLGVRTPGGKDKWSPSTVIHILRNERHCGDVRVHKTWTPNYLDHKVRRNDGDRPQYYVRDHHDPIISREDFVAVQTLLDMSRHGFVNISPELRAIPSGVLKGFVCINPRWNKFGKYEYIEASKTVGQGFDCPDRIRVSVKAGEEDLSNCEVVRGEFFEGRDHITVTFKDKEVLFSMPAIRKMNVSYVEMLIDPVGGYIAVREGSADGSYSVCWSGEKQGKPVRKKINAAGFIDAVYDLFSWNRELTYRLYGVFLEKESERVLLFDIRSTQILIPKEYADVATQVKNGMQRKFVVAYRKEWADRFGDSYYGNLLLSPANHFIDTDRWDIGRESITAFESGIRIRDREELRGEIEGLISDISDCDVVGNYG